MQKPDNCRIAVDALRFSALKKMCGLLLGCSNVNPTRNEKLGLTRSRRNAVCPLEAKWLLAFLRLRSHRPR